MRVHGVTWANYSADVDKAFETGRRVGSAESNTYKTALETVIEAAFPQYKDDLDRFVSDLAVWKDSVARQESLERLNGLNAEHLERMFDIEDLEGDGGE